MSKSNFSVFCIKHQACAFWAGAWCRHPKKNKQKNTDGQVQVLLARCHTAVATDTAGEVRGDMQRLRGGEPVSVLTSKFMHLPFSCLPFTLDWMWCGIYMSAYPSPPAATVHLNSSL